MYTVYTKYNCIFCDQAKALLRSKGLMFEEIKLVQTSSQADALGSSAILLEHFKALYPQQTTVPLILKDGVRVGGFNELKASLNILLG